ncbi:MAG: class I SAM-dependent methyltransferase [Pseudomonadota bacterium]
MALFDRSIPIPQWPTDKEIRGVGLSDWSGYAYPISCKLSYTNTFLHAEPKLDITNVPAYVNGVFDFLLSTEVFEHTPPPRESAFAGARRLLKPGGVLVLTVPTTNNADTIEHFPDLFDYQITVENGKKVLTNKTRDGRRQVFTDLKFHGGDGATLEMRVFCRSDLTKLLSTNGFAEIEFMEADRPEFGIYLKVPWSLPVVARAA